jgi:RNA polymerase sigma-70 factor (ECF subfamily)
LNNREKRNVQKEEERPPEGPLGEDRDDERRVLEFLAGRRDALAVLFRRYRNDVYEIAYRFTSNRDDALEVTQEVFMKLMESLETFRRGSRFFTWLYRIAVNQSIDYLRRRRRRATVPLEDVALVRASGSGVDPVKRAESTELAERVQSALAKLSEKHRAVLVLHSLENLSYREIAQIVGCSMGTVMSRLFYARKRLADMLGDR